MGDHVRHIHALDAHAGQVDLLVVGDVQRQRPLDERLRQVAGAEAVGGKLLAGQVN